jgi:biopolymer transport protein TolQ
VFETVWVNLVTAQAAEEAGQSLDVVGILMEASGVVLLVLLLLVLLSIGSWYVIVVKMLYLRRAKRESLQFLDIFWQSKRLDAIYQSAEEFTRSPVSQVFKAGYKELLKLKSAETEDGQTMKTQLGGTENVERALRRAMTSEITQLESLLPFLATVGSNAVFIGLFGTVWGIMVAFVNINAAGAAGLDVVAGPIAEALIVTAIGLVTAIPAGVAYNWFLSKIRVLEAEMENFSNDFLNIVKRHFFK